MKNHGLWMIICCALPLLLIFILPAFGTRNNMSLFIFIVLMFGCHLLMMRGHHGKHDEHGEKSAGKHGYH